ncbi:MAG: hypothetical protein OXQ28_00275 [Acidobacteriota bacterium]|nr:hypothetical protein [Acidobacteriota bacterium]
MTTPAVTITARRPSRWRCGVEFTDRPADFPAGHWSEDQLRRLRADAELVVSEGAGEAPADDAGTQPSTPTIQAALDTALSALRQATVDEVRAFVTRVGEDPDIRPKLEAVLVAGTVEESEPTRHERLVAAIGELEGGNKEHWTEGGQPDVFALRKATGIKDVSADERDAAFEAWKITAGRDLVGG